MFIQNMEIIVIQYLKENGKQVWSTTREVTDNYNTSGMIAQIKDEIKSSNNFGAHSVRLKYGPNQCNEIEYAL